jgi:hypothetical protein
VRSGKKQAQKTLPQESKATKKPVADLPPFGPPHRGDGAGGPGDWLGDDEEEEEDDEERYRRAVQRAQAAFPSRMALALFRDQKDAHWSLLEAMDAKKGADVDDHPVLRDDIRDLLDESYDVLDAVLEKRDPLEAQKADREEDELQAHSRMKHNTGGSSSSVLSSKAKATAKSKSAAASFKGVRKL